MTESTPLVLVPGLTCTARLYASQIVALWRYGPVTVADHRHDIDIRAVRQTHSGRGAAPFRACGPLVRRVHRLRDDAASCDPHSQAGAARYLGSTGYARTDGDAQDMDRNGANRALQRD